MRGKRIAVLLRALSYLSPHKKELLFAGIVMLGSTAISFFQPLVIRAITDQGMLEKNVDTLMWAIGMLTILVLLNQSINLLQTRLFVNVHNAVYYTLFQQVFQKLLHLKKGYFEDKNNTEILSFLQVDVSQVSSITDRYTVTVFSYVFRIISGCLGLFLISWKLAFIIIAMVPAKFILVRFLSKQQETAMDEAIIENRDFSRWFGDTLNGIDEIKLWGLFEKRNQVFQAKQKEVLRLGKRSNMIEAWDSFGEMLLEWGVIILLYLLGGLFVCWGELTIGAVFAFISYSGFVTGPIGALINLKMYFARIMPSAKRLFSFLDMETETEGCKTCTSQSPRLEFRNVCFRYDNSRSLLDDISFQVNQGEKIAIIGQNGSGKSTILKLLLRLYAPESGEILLDGESVQAFSLRSYRNLFSVVSQEPFLFMGNVTENIDLAETADEKSIEAAMQSSGVSEYLQQMPDGSKTEIGQNGARLSGGEKQKLAVARALLKDAPIVILDEATSGFDVESDAYLHEVIVNKMHKKTVIMITHHYQNLEGMDRVYRLENGKLTELSEIPNA